MLYEMRIGREIVILAMLENKDAFRLQEVALEDETGDCREFSQSVWRIGEDKVKLLLARFDEAKDISSERYCILLSRVKFLQEKVEGTGIFKVDIAREHIEDVLLGKVGGGPCLESLRNIEVPSFVFTCNDSHAYIPFTNSVSRSKGNPLILVAEWRWKSAAGFMI